MAIAKNANGIYLVGYFMIVRDTCIYICKVVENTAIKKIESGINY